MDQARKLQLEKVIFAGLLLIFGVGLINMLNVFRPAPARRAIPASVGRPPTQPAPVRTVVEAPIPMVSGERMPAHYTASQYRDPLVSLLPQPKSERAPEQAAEQPKPVVVAPALKVEGMLWGGRRPQVLIDGRLYQIGDTVQHSQIMDISRDGVTVMSQGATFVLRPPATAETSPRRPMMEHGR